MRARQAFDANANSETRRGPFTLDVPIQGGGAKSSYGYGYLYALLEDRDIYLRRISATSGAALGGAVIAGILNKQDDYDSGREKAMEGLNSFKNDIARRSKTMMQFLRYRASKRNIHWDDSDPNIPQALMDELEYYSQLRETTRNTFNIASGRAGIDMIHNLSLACGSTNCLLTPQAAGLAMITQAWGAVIDATPVSRMLNYDPLAKIIDKNVNDYASINNARHIGLFVNVTDATDPNNMQNKIYSPEDINRTVLRGTCNLRELRQTVTLDGRQILDGGYMANPSFEPIFNRPDPDRTSTLMIATNEMPADITPGKQSAFKQDMALYEAMHGEAINEFIDHAQNGDDCHLVVMPPNLGMDHTAILNTEQWWLDKLFNLGYEQAKADLPDLKANFGRRSTYHRHIPDYGSGTPDLKIAG